MEVKTAVEYLLKNGYLTILSGDIGVTNKLKREYGTNLPPDISKLTGDALYYKFVEDAEVPTYLPLGNQGKYKVRQKSDQLKTNLRRAVNAVNYKDLVEGTKLYYKSTQSNKLTLNNYFKTDAWEEAVLEYIQGTAGVMDGSNKFEE